MKTLYVVRHAKSSWDDPDKPDFDRSLNERGKRDAPRMGKRLKEKDVHMLNTIITEMNISRNDNRSGLYGKNSCSDRS